MRRRVLESLTGVISAMGPEEKVVICTHAGPSLLIGAWVTGAELPGNIFLGRLRPPGNASITTFDPHPPVLTSYNQRCHLAPGAGLRPDPQVRGEPDRAGYPLGPDLRAAANPAHSSSSNMASPAMV